MYLAWIIKGSIQFTSKRNTAFRRTPATSEDREKKKSIKLFMLYIVLKNTSYWSVSLYYKSIKMSAKYKYIFFLFFECKSELVHRSAWNWAREPNQESPRARLCVQLDVIL